MNKNNTSTQFSSLDSCFSRLASSEKSTALATVIRAISPTSAKAGDKALINSERIIDGWIGGGCAQPAVIQATEIVLQTNEPCIIRVSPKGDWEALEGVFDFGSNCLSGGTLVIFIEPLNQHSSLVILGQSPVAMILASLAQQLDFNVSLASPSLDPSLYANSLTDQNVNLINDFSVVNDADFVVIATQGSRDRAAIDTALTSNARFICMVASAKKLNGLKSILQESGVKPADVDRIKGPAGIEIGAETPEEIAISILAGLIRERRTNTRVKKTKTSTETKQKAVLPESQETLSDGGCCGS